MGVCNCSMLCCTLLYVHSSNAIILMGKRELIALLNLSSWCLVMVERLFLAVPRGSLQFLIVVFPDHTHLLFLLLMRNNDPYQNNLNTGAWHKTIQSNLILWINFAPIVMFYVVNFSQFWPGAFSQNCWIKLCEHKLAICA